MNEYWDKQYQRHKAVRRQIKVKEKKKRYQEELENKRIRTFLWKLQIRLSNIAKCIIFPYSSSQSPQLQNCPKHMLS